MACMSLTFFMLYLQFVVAIIVRHSRWAWVSRFPLDSVHGWKCWLTGVCVHEESHHFLCKWFQSGKVCFRNQTPEVCFSSTWRMARVCLHSKNRGSMPCRTNKNPSLVLKLSKSSETFSKLRTFRFLLGTPAICLLVPSPVLSSLWFSFAASSSFSSRFVITPCVWFLGLLLAPFF